MSRMRFGIFLAPFHKPGINPTLALEGDLELAHAIWDAGAVAIGWGATPEHEAAKALARAGDAAALPALLQCAGRDVS